MIYQTGKHRSVLIIQSFKAEAESLQHKITAEESSLNKRGGSVSALLRNVAKKIKTRLTAFERTKPGPGRGAVRLVSGTIGTAPSRPVTVFLFNNTAPQTRTQQL